MPETSESRIFKVIVFIIFGLISGVLLANVIYFNRIISNNGGGGVTKGEATVMFWFNLVFLIVALILFIWSLIRLIFGKEYRDKAIAYAYGESEGLYRPKTIVPLQRSTPEVEVRQSRRMRNDPEYASENLIY